MDVPQDEGSFSPLSESQKMELDRRLADYLANPDDVVDWCEVRAAALAKFGNNFR